MDQIGSCVLQLAGLLAFAAIGLLVRMYSIQLGRFANPFTPRWARGVTKDGKSTAEAVYFYGGTAFAVIALVMGAFVLLECLWNIIN